MENEGHASTRQTTRKRRNRIWPETEIKNRHREVIGVSPRHRLVKRMAHLKDNRAHPDERILQRNRKKQIIFDDEHCDAAQRIVVVH